MRKCREILKQKWSMQRTHREIAACVGTSAGAVGGVVSRAKAAGLETWEQVEAIDEELEGRLYTAAVVAAPLRPEPDYAWIHRERSRLGVALELLNQQHLARRPDGYQYTAICDRYRPWLGRRGLVMRQALS